MCCHSLFSLAAEPESFRTEEDKRLEQEQSAKAAMATPSPHHHAAPTPPPVAGAGHNNQPAAAGAQPANAAAPGTPATGGVNLQTSAAVKTDETQSSWYCGDLGKEMAEELLMSKNYNCFLIRKASVRDVYSLTFLTLDLCITFAADCLLEQTQNGSAYVLSRCVLHRSKPREVSHLILTFEHNGYVAKESEDRKYYESLIKFVEGSSVRALLRVSEMSSDSFFFFLLSPSLSSRRLIARERLQGCESRHASCCQQRDCSD